MLDPPLIRVQHVPTRSTSLEDVKNAESQSVTKSLSAQPPITSKRPKSVKKSNNIVCSFLMLQNFIILFYIFKDESEKNVKKDKESVEEEDVDDEEFIKRRGKKRRKRGRDASRGPPAFQPSLDPETQVKEHLFLKKYVISGRFVH